MEWTESTQHIVSVLRSLLALERDDNQRAKAADALLEAAITLHRAENGVVATLLAMAARADCEARSLGARELFHFEDRVIERLH